MLLEFGVLFNRPVAKTLAASLVYFLFGDLLVIMKKYVCFISFFTVFE